MPLVLGELILALIGTAGLFIDARATRKDETRVFGWSAIIIKGVLAFGLLAETVHFHTLPPALYERFGDDVTFLALVIIGAPLCAVALGCELAALQRLSGRMERTAPVVAERVGVE